MGDTCSKNNQIIGIGSTAYVDNNKSCTNEFSEPQSNHEYLSFIEMQTLDGFGFDSNQSYFLKIDTEGFEKNVLLGAQKFIRDSHPTIAAAVYHKADDIFDIMNFILGIRNDYSVYLEHYTQGFMETIMFFVPSNSKS